MVNLNKLHALLNVKGVMAQKANLVSSASNGRTESSRELTENEFDLLILSLEKLPDSASTKKLKTTEEANAQLAQLIRTALYYFRQLGYVTGTNGFDYNRINTFCTTKTAAKKRLDKMDKTQLTATITQLKMLCKHTIYSKK
ncbi:MAG: hypothetical protein JNL70_25830 [Saprospiraceae bacterium]|nr:hypothetical protein [Saprospiraceae bacterium]